MQRARHRWYTPAGMAVGAVRVYQRVMSPRMGANCRFQPTCSQYAAEAIERFGVMRGVVLGVRRIGRCHPLSPGGYDPVPDARAGE